MTTFRDIRLHLAPHIRQTQVADETGMKPAQISHFETGNRSPGFASLCKLRDFYKRHIPEWSDSFIFDGVGFDSFANDNMVGRSSSQSLASSSASVDGAGSSIDGFADGKKAFAGNAND